MRDSVRAAFVDFSARFEGVVPWLYVDVKGLVTVGIGNLVDPIQMAMPLPFVRPDGSPADRAEIAAEWLRVKNYPNAAKLGHRAVEHVAQLRLTTGGVHDLVAGKLAQFDAQLTRRFRDFQAWPADAQLATLSMAWACGAAFNFPRLVVALVGGDFSAATKLCHIDETGNHGLRPRNVANATLYRNAATVLAGGLDPETLHWPVDLSEEPTLPIPQPLPIIYALPDLDRAELDDDDEPPPKAA